MERKDWKGQWDFKKLGEVCELYQPQTISKQQLDDSAPYPVYGANGIIGRYSQFNHKEKELLMTCRGATCGTINISEAYSWINGNAMVIHPKSNCISIYFLRYLFNASDLSSIITGAAQPQITRSTLSNFPIPVPPLPVQARIVDELDCLQGILSKKRQQLAEYHSLAQAIFHQMFGDPVVNEKGWEVKRLGEVCDTHSGGTPNKSHREYYEGGNIPWLRSGEVAQLYIKNCELYITPEGLNNSSALLFPQDTVVIAMYGATAGQVGILKKEMTTNQAVCGIFPTPTFVPEFLYYTFLCIKQDLVSKAIGNAQPNISQTTIRNTLLPIPPLPLQQSFANRIAVINNQCENLNKSIHEMETLLATRMDKLLNMDC